VPTSLIFLNTEALARIRLFHIESSLVVDTSNKPTHPSSVRASLSVCCRLSGDGVYSISMRELEDQRLDQFTDQQLDYSKAEATVQVTNTKGHEIRHLAALKHRLGAKKKHVIAAKARGTRRSGNVVIAHDGTCSASKQESIANWQADAVDKIRAAKECTTESCGELVS